VLLPLFLQRLPFFRLLLAALAVMPVKADGFLSSAPADF
jgi:hypothetical protein